VQERVDAGAFRKKAPFFIGTMMGAQPSAKDSKLKSGIVRRRKPRGSRKERIAELLEKIEAQLDVGKLKITLADFIRLTQLERELEQDDQPKEIIVTWKEPLERSGG